MIAPVPPPLHPECARQGCDLVARDDSSSAACDDGCYALRLLDDEARARLLAEPAPGAPTAPTTPRSTS